MGAAHKSMSKVTGQSQERSTSLDICSHIDEMTNDLTIPHVSLIDSSLPVRQFARFALNWIAYSNAPL